MSIPAHDLKVASALAESFGPDAATAKPRSEPAATFFILLSAAATAQCEGHQTTHRQHRAAGFGNCNYTDGSIGRELTDVPAITRA